MSSEGPSTEGRVRAYLRQHHVALLALFLVLTGGTAYALDGSNTVFSDDIVNRQVKPVDVGIVPAVRATQPAGISIFDGVTCQSGVDVGAGGEYLIPFGGEDYDVGGGSAGMHASTPTCDNSTARLTAPTGGIYLITGGVRWGGLDDNCTGCEYGMKSLSIRKNGNNVLARDVRSDVTDAHGSDTVNNPTAQTVTTVVRMNSGDYVELTAKHTDISHLAQFITPGESHFTMTWLGPGGG